MGGNIAENIIVELTLRGEVKNKSMRCQCCLNDRDDIAHGIQILSVRSIAWKACHQENVPFERKFFGQAPYGLQPLHGSKARRHERVAGMPKLRTEGSTQFNLDGGGVHSLQQNLDNFRTARSDTPIPL